MSKRKIHGSRLKSAYNILNKCDIKESNRDLILEFDTFLAAKGLSDARRGKYLRYLRVVAELIDKSFSDLSKRDVVSLVGELNDNGWAEWTRVTVFILFKAFMKWLLGDGKFFPDCVSWINTNVKDKTSVERKDILEPEHIEKLVKFCENDRDRLLVSFLWESGCRIGELLNLRIGSVSFDAGQGVIVEVNGKTGQRALRLIECVHYLKTYLQNHPEPESDNFLLYDVSKKKPVSYDAVRMQLKRIAERAGVSKPVNPHNFRHSRATYLAQLWTESQMRKWFGWSPSSTMPSVYVHLTTRDLDDAVFKMYGLKTKEKQKEVMTSCEYCGKLTPKQLMFCSHCSQPINKQLVKESDMNRLKQEITQMVLKSLNNS